MAVQSIRTIFSPGIQISEIDKSQYTAPRPVQATTVGLFGFASQGEPISPKFCQSLRDFEQIFGTPKNEAERYFYYASKEVLDQGGNVVATRLPYQPTGTYNIENSYQIQGLKFYSTPVATVSGSNISLLDPWTYDEVNAMASAMFGVSDASNLNAILPVEATVNPVGLSAHYLLSADFDVLMAENTLDTVANMSTEAQNLLSAYDFAVVLESKNTLGPYKNEGIFVVFTDVFDAIASQRIASQRDLPMNCITDILLPDGTLLKQKDSTRRLWDLYSGDSISEEIMKAWPVIEYNYATSADITTGAETILSAAIKPEFTKMIGISVCQTVSNSDMGGKIMVSVLESFVGSLDANFISTSTKKNAYIRDIINTQSDYIKFFGRSSYNWLNNANSLVPLYIGNYGDESLVEPESKSVTTYSLLGFDTQTGADQQCKGSAETINDLLVGLQRISNIDEIQIDMIVDAGLSTIVNTVGLTAAAFSIASKSPISSYGSVQLWNRIAREFVNFCKDTRKDCMVIVDGPRELGLNGNIKRIRKTDPTSTFYNQIAPQLQFISNLDSSYAAEYVTWMKMNDGFSGLDFWAPPSVKVAGIYLYNDRIGNYWDAPAGLNRGVINGITDITFNVSQKEADVVYLKSLNYCKSYPTEGFVLEGQKTTQIQTSAFDRVNVRRLFLRLERITRAEARYFVYQGNTLQTQRQLFNKLNPIYSDVKIGGGLIDYIIICDGRNNTSEVVDNNELRVTIGIQPTKTAEFILIDFVALKTGANFTEVLGL